MTREDLKDGEIYICKEWCDYLIKYHFSENTNLIVTSYINIEKLRFHNINFNRSLTTKTNLVFEEATPEQKHWLLECEKADKFISYDEAMKTFVKEFVLPEKWCIKSSFNSDVHKWFERKLNRKVSLGTDSFFHYPEYYSGIIGICTSSWIEQGYSEITLEQFKQYVLKENKLPYNILKQEGNKILQVQNSEGSVFDIGDMILGLKMKKYKIIPLKIIELKLNKNNKGIIAICNKSTSNGISIDKIEHYIEPKAEFILPETWWVRVTEDNKHVLSKWRFNDSQKLLEVNKLVGIARWNRDGRIDKGHNPSHLTRDADEKYGYNFGNEITFDQFKKYVLKEVEVKNTMHDMIEGQAKLDRPDLYDIKLPIVDEVKESLLDKAKRLYPIGTKFRNDNILSYTTNRIVTIIGHNFRKIDNKGDLLIDGSGTNTDSAWTLYNAELDKWAEIVQ